MHNLTGKKIVMIIPHKDFRDPELLEPKKILENYGAKVTLASSTLNPCRGAEGNIVKPEILVDNLKVANYDAIAFIGGPGTGEYFENKRAHLIAKETAAVEKILAAICAGPIILANAGVLKNKRATVTPSGKDVLKAKDAIYTGELITVDGNIITANGPQAARDFGEAIAKALA